MAQAKAKDTAADPFDDIRKAVTRRFGAAAKIDNITIATLGGSNRTVIFDLVEGGSPRRLVSRQETYTGEEKMFISPADQYKIMQAVHKAGLPVPEPVFEYDDTDAMGHGFVTGFVAGETMPKTIINSPDFAGLRRTLPAQCGEILARLHALDLSQFGFLENLPDSKDPVTAFLERYDFYGEVHPALELGFRWLERNRPKNVKRSFLHGDFRCGNLMVGPENVRAVLDWECSHLGSGMEDLGWLCTRSWRFDRVDQPVGGFGQREPLFEAYHAAGGEKVDPDAVRYWEIFGLVRWAIYNIMQAYGHVFTGRSAVTFAACGRNSSMIEYDLLMSLKGHYN